jgi:ABC-type molybdenum transport system ATPase subunit/photorepair protein PhrA
VLLFFDMTITFGYKVKVNAQVKVFLKHAMQVQCGNSGIALSILNLSAKGRWVLNTIPWQLHPPERAPVSTVQEPG